MCHFVEARETTTKIRPMRQWPRVLAHGERPAEQRLAAWRSLSDDLVGWFSP